MGKELKIQGYNVDVAKKMANYFFEIGRETHLSVDESGCIYKSIVGNVNMTFACEIILKILNYEEGVNLEELYNKHWLNKLFNLLSEEKRNIIKKDTIAIANSMITNQDPYLEKNFYEDLNVFKNAYEECRYWYEIPAVGKKGKKANQLFSYSFGTALIKWIQ